MKKIISILIIMMFIIAPLVVTSDTIIKENPYNGILRIYITEISSRTDMYNGEPYHYSLIDIPYNVTLSLDYLETLEESFNWQGNVGPDNLMIMAAIFNPESQTNYADPPNGAPFNAYSVDAAAGTKPGYTDSNNITEDFTHTVFIEEGTATWCPSCPAAGAVLYSIYESGDYPFFYVAMVVDVNEVADTRMEDYNLYWLPSSFCDGGNEVVVGSSEIEIRNAIESTGQRDVHELDLILSVEYLGSGEIKIDFSVTNIENYPPEKPNINGPSSGSAETEYEYKFQASDPEGQEITICIDWGDGTGEVCLAPVQSGQEVAASHSWTEQDTYIIKAKTRDSYGAESDWTILEVTMPKNKSLRISLMSILDKYPLISQILNKILE